MALSNTCLKYIVESDWLTPSRYVKKEVDDSLKREIDNWHSISNNKDVSVDTIFNNLEKRHVVVYFLHTTISTCVRVIAVLAIDVIVPPVGVVYHSIQALRNHNIKDLKEVHLTNVDKELLKIAIVVSLVAFPFLPVELAMNPEISKVFFFSALILLGEIVTTAFAPLYNSRGLFEGSDFDWEAKMGLKWNLGLEVNSKSRELLEIASRACAKKMLADLSAIQDLLPTKHLLPYDPKMKVNWILPFLEQSRPHLPKHVWESIKPHRESLIKYNDLLKDLEGYMEFVPDRFDLNKLQDAYKAQGKKQLVQERPAYDLHIHSLSSTLFKGMLSLSLFYPSDCETQIIEKDEGSIKESLRGFNPYTNRKIKAPSTIVKCSTYVARFFATLAIKGVGAPLGVVTHIGLSVVYLGLAAVQGSDARYGNLSKVEAHAFAALEDFTNIFFGWTLAFYPNQEYALNCLAFAEERPGLFKAMILKKRFGVMGPRGGLLSYSLVDDVPKVNKPDAFLWQLRNSQSLVLHAHLQKIYSKLSPIDQNEMNYSFQAYIHSGKLTCTALLEAKCTKEEINQIHKAVESLQELKTLLDEICTITEGDYHYVKGPIEKKFSFPYYSYDFNGFGPTTASSRVGDPWMQELARFQKTIQDLGNPESNNDAYKAVKADVSKTITPLELFGFDKNHKLSSADQPKIKKAYYKYSMLLHPDKWIGSPEALQKEAEEIFKLIGNAKTLLESQYS